MTRAVFRKAAVNPCLLPAGQRLQETAQPSQRGVCCVTVSTSICPWYPVFFVLSSRFLKFYCCFEQKCLLTCKYFAYIVLQPCYLHLLHAYSEMAHFHLASIIARHSTFGFLNYSSQSNLCYKLLWLLSSALRLYTLGNSCFFLKRK